MTSDSVTINCEYHHRELTARLWNCFLSKRGVDFDLTCGRRSIGAHRLLLDLFLSSHRLQQIAAAVQQESDDFNGALDSLLQFLYTGQLIAARERLPTLRRLATQVDFELLLHALQEKNLDSSSSQDNETDSSRAVVDVGNLANCSFERPKIEDTAFGETGLGQQHREQSDLSSHSRLVDSVVPPNKIQIEDGANAASDPSGNHVPLTGIWLLQSTFTEEQETLPNISDGIEYSEHDHLVDALSGERTNSAQFELVPKLEPITSDQEDDQIQKVPDRIERNLRNCSDQDRLLVIKTEPVTSSAPRENDLANHEADVIKPRPKTYSALVLNDIKVERLSTPIQVTVKREVEEVSNMDIGQGEVTLDAPSSSQNNPQARTPNSDSNKTATEGAKSSTLFRRGLKRRKGLFWCQICKSSFTRNYNLVQHSRIHSGEKPYECNVCKASFTQLGVLKRHLEVHAAGASRQLQCPECPSSFKDESDLSAHLEVHRGPHECELCHQKFYDDESRLKRRLRSHSTAEKPRICDVCSSSKGSVHAPSSPPPNQQAETPNSDSDDFCLVLTFSRQPSLSSVAL